MANFKGGFAFNNEAAKVEVEQAPDGTLISCVNPVTGEGLVTNNVEEFEGTAANLIGDYPEATYIDNLLKDIYDGNVSIQITFDLSAASLPEMTIWGAGDTIHKFYGADLDPTYVTGVYFEGGETAIALDDGTAFRLYAGLYKLTNGSSSDMTEYGAMIPTVTKIYHHPMS